MKAVAIGILPRSALTTGRRILQRECYRTRHVPVNIILRVTETRHFDSRTFAEFPIWDALQSSLGFQLLQMNLQLVARNSFAAVELFDSASDFGFDSLAALCEPAILLFL